MGLAIRWEERDLWNQYFKHIFSSMNLASSFQISPRISGRRNCESGRGAQGCYRGSRVIHHWGGEWIPIALQGQNCWRENTALNTSSRSSPFAFFSKNQGKSSCKCQSQRCLGWHGMEVYAGTFPAASVVQGLTAASWAPHGKINGCCKSSSLNVCQDFLVFLEPEHFMYHL